MSFQGVPGVTAPGAPEGVSLRDQLEAAVLAKSSRGLRMLGQNGAFSGGMVDGLLGGLKRTSRNLPKNTLKQKHLPFDSAVFFGGKKGWTGFVWAFSAALWLKKFRTWG